ncbi:MAG: hypothetical protein ACOYOB_18105 [Myxococcota bacterium]
MHLHGLAPITLVCVALAGLVFACGAETSLPAGADATPDTTAASDVDEPSIYLPEDLTQTWQPGRTLRLRPDQRRRDLRDVRGIIHTHSPYSHDACDDEPQDKDGKPNAQCFEDVRFAVCKVRHDFVMLSDHPTLFADHDFPEVLLYRAERGDTLVKHGDLTTAARLACAGAPPVLLLGGTEGSLMPVGLEGHVAATPDERHAVYGSADPQQIEVMRAHGAVILAQHTEDWTPEQLATLPIDGFEMYNLHANLMTNIPKVVKLLPVLLNTEGKAPHPDLVLLGLLEEDERYASRWGTVLAGGAKRVTTLATDSHRNALPMELPDGERVDSFRRMMSFFSNHLLVHTQADGSFDDRDLKDALRSGRLYGAFELLGFPDGFDYHAVQGGASVEMGGEVSIAQGATLELRVPGVAGLDPSVPAPDVTPRILRARVGGFDVVATGAETHFYVPTEPGAYRAEVRIRPRHLVGFLGDLASLGETEFPWVMSNPVYVVK